MTIFEKLVELQSKLKAPKSLNNTFGGYKYRNAEQIFEAFKPHGAELGLALTVSDEIVAVGNWVYVKATATLTDKDNPVDNISVTAWAREAEGKKGMDSAQVTGATSSYARKYALNGLFLLDDTKDQDTDEYRKESEERTKADLICDIRAMLREKGYAESGTPLEERTIKDLKDYYGRLAETPSRKGKKGNE